MRVTNCIVDGENYTVNENAVFRRLISLCLTEEERIRVAEAVLWFMADLEIDSRDCRGYDNIEDRYAEACIGYIEDNSVEEFLEEEDATRIFEYLDCFERDIPVECER